MPNKVDFLEIVIDRLEKRKVDILSDIQKLLTEKENYLESNKEILGSEKPIIKIPEADENRINDNINKYQKNIDMLELLLTELSNQNSAFHKIMFLQVNMTNLEDFKNLVIDLVISRESEFFNVMNTASKIAGVKYQYTSKNIKQINEEISKAQRINKEAMESGYTDNTILVIKQIIGPISSFFSKNISFLKEVIQILKSKKADIEKEKDIIAERETEKRKQEIFNHTDELVREVEKLREVLSTIEKIKVLCEEEKEIEGSLPKDLIDILSKLKIINGREVKIITHIKKEKPKEEVVKEDPVETKKTEIVIQPKTLTNPIYYKEPDTQNIICFLGTDDNNIFTDIENHFDYSNRHSLLGSLVRIFNTLYINKDYEGKTGGNPKYFASAEVKAYLNRLGFNYLRLGVSESNKRIHAVTRDSKLLKELGYGIGRVTFFGALGVNDDNEKTGAYDRIAGRGIQNLLGNKVKLQPNFDYIEHIMRAYIPYELLSASDKDKKVKGMFNGKYKGTKIDKTIENYQYFYYYALDDETKDNVKKWLDNYFEKQSEKMFEVINEYNRKKKTID